jgi:DNA polymerase
LSEHIDALLTGDAALVETLYGPPMQVISDCLRGMIAAPPGRTLYAADFSSIEAIVTPWLAGDRRKLRVFEDYFAGKGPKPYNVAAGQIFGIAPEKVGKGDKYQVGKAAELALGFQGGAMAFLKMAKSLRVDIAIAAEPVRAAATAENIEKAEDAWEQRGKRSGADHTRWTTGELIKLAWRQAHPEIVQFWRDLEDAAIAAVQEPGTMHRAGEHIAYKAAGSFLFCRLPSGRVISYPYPKIVEKEMPWTDSSGNPVKKPALQFMGVNSVTRQWGRQDFYGGNGCQNVVEGVARDLLVNGMQKVEAAGYEVILTIHDEVVAETAADFGSKDEFMALMVDKPSWAKGLPVTASGFRAERYRK